jgi:DNA-binding MarR family transcriptional regulator
LRLGSILGFSGAASRPSTTKHPDEVIASEPALKALDEAGEPVPLGQFAERLSCVKSNITQFVDRLEVDGLVARRPDPRDRRTKLAALTTAGRRDVRLLSVN